ncbi:alpha/beta hydrolase [Litoribacillus peritrichatus]|uniref:Alpha/beta hydrolase n=1 Tax=Litoribacillus peritrichatus TaxID=718191 RepID=A0ABP7LZ31_9GAMM
MASLRAQVIKKTLRSSIKPLLSPNTSITTQRRLTDFGLQLNILPFGTEISETELDGIPTEWVSNKHTLDCDNVILYLHGGAYNIGSPKSHRNVTAHLARATGSMVLAIDYRLAPEHPCPAGLSDVIKVYRWLLAHDHNPKNLAIAGDSAGGGLTVASVLEMKEENLPLPAVLGVISPWVDLTMSGESVRSNAAIDPMIRKDWLEAMINNYATDLAPSSPLCSPINGDLTGLPPLLIQVGSDEILLDDAIRLAQRAESYGVSVELDIWESMWHVWHFQAGLIPEADQAIQDLANHLLNHLPA